jgi:hypothetical protein
MWYSDLSIARSVQGKDFFLVQLMDSSFDKDACRKVVSALKYSVEAEVRETR